MCSRYFLDADGNVIAYTFNVPVHDRIRKRFNIAPTQEAPVVRMTDAGVRGVAMLRWGLVPSWARDPAIGNRMINARSETAAEKPSFRNAMKSRRCLVPASGFYEWTGVAGHKIAHAITLADQPVFAFAGLWESWLDKSNPGLPPVETYTLLTTGANRALSTIHDRMPVILAPADHQAWLEAPARDAAQLLRPYADEPMRERVVSTRVNNPRNESPDLLGSADEPPQPSGMPG
ncbi:MAG: SOS response-associated peptidase [Betaproteobacteria bacterium]|nr:SOS response-associated peptidase [Betaproteobacteria bacterium]